MFWKWLKRQLNKTFIGVMILAVLDVEIIVFCVVIGPFLYIALVCWLQANFHPLGAILFWAIYLPLILGAAAVDYVRKHPS